MHNFGCSTKGRPGEGETPELAKSVRVEAVEIAGRRFDAVVVEIGGLRLRADVTGHRLLMLANRLAQTHGATFDLDPRIAQAFGVDADELAIEHEATAPELIYRVRVAPIGRAGGRTERIQVYIADIWLWLDVQSDYDLALAARLAASHRADFDVRPTAAAPVYAQTHSQELH